MKPETAAAVADWWAAEFGRDDKRAAFRDELYRRVLAEDFDDDEDYGASWKLSVDYDPCPTLRAAIRAIGYNCRGFLFSAEGFLPAKTRMRIWRDTGTVEVQQIVRVDGVRRMQDVTIAGPQRQLADQE